MHLELHGAFVLNVFHRMQDTSHCSITLLGPPDKMTEVAFTARALHLIIRQYETHLAFRYPFKQLHVAFVPAAAFRALHPPILVGTNIILVSEKWDSNDHGINGEPVP